MSTFTISSAWNHAVKYNWVCPLIQKRLSEWQSNICLLHWYCKAEHIFAKFEAHGKLCWLKMVRSDNHREEHEMLRMGKHIFTTQAVRLQNEHAAPKYVRENTDIPVPLVIKYCDKGPSPYLVIEFIESRSMEDVFNSDQREHLACMMRLEALVEKTRKYTRPEPGSFVGEFIPPGRLCIDRDSFTRIVTSDKFKPDADFPLCHGDISRFNVLIHPERPEIIALVDWEFAGFYPHQLDPSYAEQDDHGVALGWVSIQAQLFGQACLLRVQNKEERHGNMVQMLGFHNPFD